MDYKIVKKIARDCFRIDRIKYDRAPVLTVAHDNDRHFLYQDKFYSPLVSTMEDDLARRGVASVSVARIISTIKGEKSHGRVFSPEGAFARSLVGKRLRAALRRGRYAYSRSEEAIWDGILERTGARTVFGIQPSRELCVACHRRGIWVADVQHGVIAEQHPWYGAAFRGAEPAAWLPSAFLCWDEGSADVTRPWAGPKGVRSEVIGNRWLARFARPAPHDAMVRELHAASGLALAGAARPTILLTLSWGNHNIPNGFISDALEAVIRSTATRYRWLIRLHPNQIRGFATHEGPDFIRYFERRLRGCADWELATHAPLPVVLGQTALHVSWNSSVSIEAAQMGIRSLLLDPRLRSDQLRDYYTHYRANGMIELMEAEEGAIAAWIERHAGATLAPESFEPSEAAYGALLDMIAQRSHA